MHLSRKQGSLRRGSEALLTSLTRRLFSFGRTECRDRRTIWYSKHQFASHHHYRKNSNGTEKGLTVALDSSASISLTPQVYAEPEYLCDTLTNSEMFEGTLEKNVYMTPRCSIN